jgi:hypothetical protein
MNAAKVKKRGHSGPTTRVSEKIYRQMEPLLFSKDPSTQVARSLNVNRKTVQLWRKFAKAAVMELGPKLQFPSTLATYKALFIKKGPVEIQKELKVSKEAVKGLEIILRANGLLKGSRVDNIKAGVRKWGIIDKTAIMREYGLDRTIAEKIQKGKR